MCFLQRKTFGVTATGKGCCGLTLDWQTGFTLNEGTDGSVIWQFKFSQLRGSSDDGKSKLKLHFQDSDTRVIETKVRDLKMWCKNKILIRALVPFRS